MTTNLMTNFKKGNMGTLVFDAKFPGMRKEQDFIVYPMNQAPTHATIQSDTRIGRINLQSGEVALTPPHAEGAFANHLPSAKLVCTLSGEELMMFKTQIMTTASGKAGTNGIIHCDNSAAIDVFAGAPVEAVRLT